MRRVCCGGRCPGPRTPRPHTSSDPTQAVAGLAELWARFDAAVAGLNEAITGSDAAKVADAFGEMSEAAGALADAVASEDSTAERAPAAQATRGAA